MSRAKVPLDFNPYDVLELSKDCTDKEVIKAYRKIALKWHPDKNPDRKEFATQMFLKVSRAFEILSDSAARGAYDQVIAAKSAKVLYAQRRQETENANRRRLREELERREAEAAIKTQLDAEEAVKNFEKEVERLRKEGSKLLQKERENIEKEVHSKANSVATPYISDVRLKIRWDSKLAAIYDESKLRQIFGKFGDISVIVVSKAGKGSAMLDFQTLRDLEGLSNESGLAEAPLKITWLSERPKYSTFSSIPKQPQTKEVYVSHSQFLDFEQEVLAKMISGSKRKFDET